MIRHPAAAFIRLPTSRHHQRQSQRGAGMIGFLAVLIPLLSLGMGGVELAHWLNLRQTLSLALMDAARAGATRQARPQAIADAFEQGLRPVYPQPASLARALQVRRRHLGVPWRIHILLPTPAAFLDHADASLNRSRQTSGQALIRNDYQALQQDRRIHQGWPQGRGPHSGITIFQANTLLMDLWWPQAPLLPGVAAIVRALAPVHGDPVGRQMMQNGYLPFRRRIRMVMQSHPAAWPDLPDGRVVHTAFADAALPGTQTEPPSISDPSLPKWDAEQRGQEPVPPDDVNMGALPVDAAPGGTTGAVNADQDSAHGGAGSRAPDTCTP